MRYLNFKPWITRISKILIILFLLLITSKSYCARFGFELQTDYLFPLGTFGKAFKSGPEYSLIFSERIYKDFRLTFRFSYLQIWAKEYKNIEFKNNCTLLGLKFYPELIKLNKDKKLYVHIEIGTYWQEMTYHNYDNGSSISVGTGLLGIKISAGIERYFWRKYFVNGGIRFNIVPDTFSISFGISMGVQP